MSNKESECFLFPALKVKQGENHQEWDMLTVWTDFGNKLACVDKYHSFLENTPYPY